MKKRLILLLSIPFLLSSCGGGEQPPFDNDEDKDDDTIFDDGGMFDDDESEDVYIPELKEDTATNYAFEDVENTGGATYEIFVRSFYDSDGDGIGDLNGVTEKLSYLKDLGINNIWLMPIQESPSYHGYDIEDYYSIEKDYGTLEDFKVLTEKADELGINIIMDLVINHSSSTNPWFIQSAKDYYLNNTSEGSKKDWYIWKDNSASNFYEYNGTGAYYEGDFGSSMPDFNLDNEEVRAELSKVIKYWLDLGVDGFRLDAVLYYYGNSGRNIEFLNWIKDTAESYKENTYIVGEAWISTQGPLNEYYQSKVDSFFNFPSSLNGNGNDSMNSVIKGFTSAYTFGNAIESKETAQKENNPKGRTSYFLSNHDMDRSSQNFTGDLAKVASSLMTLLPGNPYYYYGEEIGLKGYRKDSEGTDAARRLPMIWSETNKEGECDIPDLMALGGAGYNPEQVTKGAADLIKENYSLVNHYKKAINLRNKYSFIQDATFKNLTKSDGDKSVLVYKLTNGADSIVVCHNFNETARAIDLSDYSTKILDSINTTRKIPEMKNGTLSIGGYSTVILDSK